MDNMKLVYTVTYEGPDLTMEGPKERHAGEWGSYEAAERAFRVVSDFPNGRKNVRIQHRWVTDWEDSDD